MIVDVANVESYWTTKPLCNVCNIPAPWADVEPDFDRLGLYVGDVAVRHYCDGHIPRPRQVPRAIERDCPGCGPDHPTCRSPEMTAEQRERASVPASITRDQYLTILRTYGFDPDNVESMYMDASGIEAKVWGADKTEGTYAAYVPVVEPPKVTAVVTAVVSP